MIVPLPKFHWKGQMKFTLLEREGYWGLFKQEFYCDGKSKPPIKKCWYCVIKIITQVPMNIKDSTIKFESKENTIGSSAGGLAYWTYSQEGTLSSDGCSGLDIAHTKYLIVVNKFNKKSKK
jgi:hypothetical protein